MARLSILTQEEIDSLYSIPHLDDDERSFLFTLDDEDRLNLNTLKTVPRKINYTLITRCMAAYQFYWILMPSQYD